MFKFLIKSPSVLANTKFVYYFDQLLEAFKNQSTKTEGSLLNELFNLFKKFYGNVGSPEFGLQFKVTAQEGLDSIKYNNMSSALSRDLELAYTQQNSIDQSLIINYNYFELKKNSILNLLKECNEQLLKIESAAKSKNTVNIELGEYFNTDYAFDYAMSSNFVNFDPTLGGITLKLEQTPVDVRDYISNIVIQLFFDGNPIAVGGDNNAISDGKLYGIYGDMGENGRRIGLSLIASYLSNAPAPSASTSSIISSSFEGISFDAGTQNVSLISKLFDVEGQEPNLNTFLEFEYVALIKQDVPTITQALKDLAAKINMKSVGAVNYSQPFIESKDGHKLSMMMTINLREPFPVNHIQITTHNFGENTYINMKNLKVLDNTLHTVEGFTKTSSIIKSQSSSMANNNYSNAKKWVFPSTSVRQIVMELEQDMAYPVRYSLAAFIRGNRLGSQAIADLWDISSKALFKDVLKQFGSFCSQYPESINSYIDKLSLNPAQYARVSSMYWAGINRLVTSFGKNGIVDIPRNESNRFRYAIGLSNIAFGLFRYSGMSELISKPSEVGNIKQIQIEASDMIPVEFPTGEWIKYFISFDSGLTWNRINPFNHTEVKFDDGFVIPKTIYCNSEIPEEFKIRNKSGKYAFVETEDKNKNIRVKVELSRPSEADYETMSPIVYEVKLTLMTLK